jgi:hypothetical protein
MTSTPITREFINAVQVRAARVAVGPSAVRGQGAPGIAQAARSYLATMPLAPFGISDSACFTERLEHATKKLAATLPSRGRSWGVARKLLNIFLRDAFYTVYLRDYYKLDRAEALFEMPLDSITVRSLKAELPRGQLSRWPGVKHLKFQTSEEYQKAAAVIASDWVLARVHLDTYWWGGNRNGSNKQKHESSS